MKLTLDTLRFYCEEEGDCLLWKLSCKRNGYPQAYLDGKTQLVARYVYTALLGHRLMKGHRISPKCGNARCVSPSCLQALTFSTILTRSYATGKRSTVGEYAARLDRAKAQGFAKLTPEQVEQIRQAEGTHAAVSKLYGVGPKAISAIRNGRSWRVRNTSAFSWRPA